MTKRIPLFEIYWDDADITSVTQAISSGRNWAIGPYVNLFEDKIRNYVRVKYARVFSSGTSALHSALLAYNIGPADEVIVPSFTFIATANAPLFVGAKPVFADIEEQTFGLDPEQVNERITHRTKAIIPVHYGGCPSQIRELKKIAQDNRLILIEDAAESFGARIGTAPVGSFGDAAMFSFCQNKIVSTGEGGAITTDSEQICNRLEIIRSHGQSHSRYQLLKNDDADYVALGYNFRMSNITAALGVTQLDKVEALIDMRRENARYLTSKLKREVQHVTLPSPPPTYRHVYQMYTIRHPQRDQLMQHLFEKGIMTKVYFHPVHKSYFYTNILKDTSNLPVTEEIASQVLSLPMFPHLKKEEIDRVVSEIGICTS